MEIKTIVELITTLGFPITLVLAMGWFIYQLWQQSKERETKLYTELAECRKVNEQAINTIATYAEKLDIIQKDVAEIKTDVTTLMNG